MVIGAAATSTTTAVDIVVALVILRCCTIRCSPALLQLRMHVGRKAADSALLNGRGDPACRWLLRHTRSDGRQWTRPSLKSSTTAAETIATMLAVGGPNSWSAAVSLYTEALATHSILRRGVVAHRERHTIIARILSAMAESGAMKAPSGVLAERMARDIRLPHENDNGDEASHDERNAMSEACTAILSALFATGEFEAAQRCILHWWHYNSSPMVVRQVLLSLMLASARSGVDVECRAALLRLGFLQHLEKAMGTTPFNALLLLLEDGKANGDNDGGAADNRGEVDCSVARWCVDVALHMHWSPWRLLCKHVPPSRRLSDMFYRELVACCCTCRQLPMPSGVVDLLPTSVICDAVADVLRCCWSSNNNNSSSSSSTTWDAAESTLQRLRDAVSAALASQRLCEEAVVCLDIFSRLCKGTAVAQDVVWWCDHMQRCYPATVDSAMLWTALRDRMGLSDLQSQPLPASPKSLPFLVLQASRSITSAAALFATVQRGDAGFSDVGNIPWNAARNVLLLCGDNNERLPTTTTTTTTTAATGAVDWVLRHCRDREGLARFVVDHVRTHRAAASAVLRALLQQPEHTDVLMLLSRLLEGRGKACMEKVVSLAPQKEHWIVALRCLSNMTAPSIGHLHTAFVALAGHLSEPFSLSVEFLWSDGILTSLRANVSPALWRVAGDRWEAALRILSMSAERMKHHPLLLQRHADALFRATAFNPLVRDKVGGFLARLHTSNTTESSSRSSREEILAFVRSRQWMAACSLATQTGPTYGLVELLAHHGRWKEAAQLVATTAEVARKEAWAPLVVRAARFAGQWQVALHIVERMTAGGLRLHYATIAELLACCAASDVPLKAVQLWLLGKGMKKAAAYFLVGLGSGKTSTNSAACGGPNAAQTELLFVLLDATASSSSSSLPQLRDRQWQCALQLLTAHVRQCNGSPSLRVLHTTFSILRRVGMWRKSLRLLQLQRSLGVPPAAKSVRLVIDALPPSEWRSALLCLRDIPRGDTGVLHRVLPLVLPVRWECALQLLVDHCVATNTAMECIVDCEVVPLPVRLQAWVRLLPSLPVSMRHRAAPVYLRLSLAVADNMVRVADGIDGLTIIERSIRGLRRDFKNYPAFVHHRAVVHRHWCDKRLDPSAGMTAFRSLVEIAGRDPQCEVSVTALEQLADLSERVGS